MQGEFLSLPSIHLQVRCQFVTLSRGISLHFFAASVISTLISLFWSFVSHVKWPQRNCVVILSNQAAFSSVNASVCHSIAVLSLVVFKCRWVHGCAKLHFSFLSPLSEPLTKTADNFPICGNLKTCIGTLFFLPNGVVGKHQNFQCGVCSFCKLTNHESLQSSHLVSLVTVTGHLPPVICHCNESPMHSFEQASCTDWLCDHT